MAPQPLTTQSMATQPMATQTNPTAKETAFNRLFKARQVWDDLLSDIREYGRLRGLNGRDEPQNTRAWKNFKFQCSKHWALSVVDYSIDWLKVQIDEIQGAENEFQLRREKVKLQDVATCSALSALSAYSLCDPGSDAFALGADLRSCAPDEYVWQLHRASDEDRALDAASRVLAAARENVGVDKHRGGLLEVSQNQYTSHSEGALSANGGQQAPLVNSLGVQKLPTRKLTTQLLADEGEKREAEEFNTWFKQYCQRLKARRQPRLPIPSPPLSRASSAESRQESPREDTPPTSPERDDRSALPPRRLFPNSPSTSMSSSIADPAPRRGKASTNGHTLSSWMCVSGCDCGLRRGE
ncbi:hypothetical protein MMC21_005831 [Puttea exsequens]|nr:hypothetical protein [Puttea exsequens]